MQHTEQITYEINKQADTTRVHAIATHEQASVLPSLRVLLVDDDELVLKQLEGVLCAKGFEVSTATGSLEALASLRANFSPVVITDLKMPGIDELELCRTIREQSWPGYIYILMLTAQAAEKDILAGLSAGADDYLTKRMSPAQLLARLRTAERILTLECSLKAALAERGREALTDSLTGAPNRRYSTSITSNKSTTVTDMHQVTPC